MPYLLFLKKQQNLKLSSAASGPLWVKSYTCSLLDEPGWEKTCHLGKLAGQV